MIANRTLTPLSTASATPCNPFIYCYSRIQARSQTADIHSTLDRRNKMQKSRRQPSRSIGWTIVALAALALMVPQAASAWWWIQPEYEVRLKVIGSSVFPFRSDDPADFWMVSTSGWPLTMFLRADHEYLGIGTPYGYPYYPTMDTPLPFPLVFGDENAPYGPDECPSWNDPLGFVVDGCINVAQPWPVDETILPFIPGLTVPDSCCSDRPNCCTGAGLPGGCASVQLHRRSCSLRSATKSGPDYSAGRRRYLQGLVRVRRTAAWEPIPTSTPTAATLASRVWSSPPTSDPASRPTRTSTAPGVATIWPASPSQSAMCCRTSSTTLRSWPK